ncbi:hypothetical protein B0H99_101359 [Planomicrobium soli]|uniref:Uncharacterized protein n=1 Tax=Planomicrobium soli TaxID=1176648 RepID=A0A2P8H7D8_9BACL|nr:hypothetical protein [Planomicrobium soli]PSL42111.1 hypothetical protein B0H99_101359 [Planomicrobium soli]
MKFTLEKRDGLTMEDTNMLTNIANITGVSIAEYNLTDDFFAAYFKTVPFEGLYDLYKGKAGKLSNSMLVQIQAELDRRYSNALAD